MIIITAVIMILMIWAGPKFAHATTSQLSWYVQNCDLIRSIFFKQEQHEFLWDFTYEFVNRLQNTRPQVISNQTVAYLLHICRRCRPECLWSTWRTFHRHYSPHPHRLSQSHQNVRSLHRTHTALWLPWSSPKITIYSLEYEIELFMWKILILCTLNYC